MEMGLCTHGLEAQVEALIDTSATHNLLDVRVIVALYHLLLPMAFSAPMGYEWVIGMGHESVYLICQSYVIETSKHYLWESTRA